MLDPALQALLRAEILGLQDELRRRDAEIAELRRQTGARRTGTALWLRPFLISLRRRFTLFRHGRSFRQQLTAIEASDLFDAEWYAARHPECGGVSLAAIHYLRIGAFAGHDPGPYFDTTAYLRANPDVVAARQPALAHYLLHGQAEGRPLRPASPCKKT